MKSFTNSRKFLFGVSVSMVLAMAIGSFALGETQTPASPMAVEAQSLVGATAGAFTVNGGTQGTDYEFTGTTGTDGVLKIHPQSIETNITISNAEVTTDRIEVTSAATITLAGVDISTGTGAALQIQDNATFNVNILLEDGSNNILETTKSNYAGLQKNGSGDSIGTLTIGVPSGSVGTGALEATGGFWGAGIGSGYGEIGSYITISGGEVTATGGRYGAGIGGGNGGIGSNITITGGDITANGESSAAGIGGGNSKNGSDITINGGVVTATGGQDAACIGGGKNGSGSNITINGGVVMACGRDDGGAGIGGGDGGVGSHITITGGEVTAESEDGAGIGGGDYADGSDIMISGGVVTVTTSGNAGAGIGGGNSKNGSNITISGGVVTANPGSGAAGIGGGTTNGSGSNITIRGGVVKAIGGHYGGAGIGGGSNGSGSNITISGGVVTATGGSSGGAGIGGGSNASVSGSGNSLNGDAVVLATSGNASKAALEGFVDDQQESFLIQGIAFTRQTESGTWSGEMYGDSVTISQNVEFPADLTVGTNQSNPQELIVDTNVTLTISAGATLQNEGILTISGTVDCLDDQATGTTGEVTTKTDFYLEGSTDVYATGYQTYQTSAGVQKYTNLPNPDQTNANGFVNWYYVDQDGKKIKIDENSFVALNAHSFYENLYAISITKQGEGEITPNVTEAAKDDTVTFEATPAEGYQLKESSLIVTDADGNEVPVTEEDGKYTFTMPGADVTVSAVFELIPEPEPIPDPSVDPNQGDGSDASSKTGDSFAGIAALAILGLATTGAALLRKRK